MDDASRMQAPSQARHLYGGQEDYGKMHEMISAFSISQIVHAAAVYSLAEHLADGLATPAEIAAAESINVDATLRLMSACVSIGLMSYDGQEKFSATPLLKTLHKDDPNSMRGAALVLPAPGHWLPWSRLSDAVRTGKPQAAAALGRDLWDYFADTPNEAKAFTQTMKAMTASVSHEAASLIDTQAARVAVDIGGASGTLIHALMEKNPSLQGMVFDLPHVVPDAIKAAEALGFQNRFSAVSGDFLVSVPPADLYLLKSVLIDWPDDTCIAILKSCRRAVKPNGRLVLIDLMSEIGAPGIAPMADLTMMVLFGSRIRRLEEYTALLTAAGFRFSRATATSTPFTLIEALPAPAS
ncbi:MAG: methyltransferase [Dongiaceae bacterium]